MELITDPERLKMFYHAIDSYVEYREWPRNPKYRAGDDGSIIGLCGQLLAPFPNKRGGYLSVSVGRRDKKRVISVHIIVCESWHGLRPHPRLEVAHGNGVNTDNRPENLRWATRLENAHDMIKHGTVLRGERHPHARLTAENVEEIRADYSTGTVSQRELGSRYGVTMSLIGQVVRGQIWTHIEGEVNGNHERRGESVLHARLTEGDVRAIRQAAATGTSQSELGRRYGVAQSTIGGIVHGRKWKHVVA